jgi:hypothetical protein
MTVVWVYQVEKIKTQLTLYKIYKERKIAKR